jgi:ADP-heptose:LPS heptosyltransferase
VNVLIIKLGATGDVVRTTPLLHEVSGHVTWITAAKNVVLFGGCKRQVRGLSWEQREQSLDRHYDLVINLEDTADIGMFAKRVPSSQLFGAYSDDDGSMRYTNDAQAWFDLSIISRHGKAGADLLKLQNRKTYQELIFEGLDLRFAGHRYFLPQPVETDLYGDIAIAAEAGPVWPMKKWAYYPELKERLVSEGLTVNFLPKRSTLLEHLADVANHRCLVAGDSLPMHFALGTGTRCVTLFNCTSPWEIYEYGLQTKIISPLLAEFFYQRGYDERATTAINVDEVFQTVISQLENSPSRVTEGATT